MTIIPNMLTEEAGFVESKTVVEIGYKPYKNPDLETSFDYGKLCKVWPDSIETVQEESPYGFDWIVSLRAITGPLAHWSLDMVPDDAEWSVVTAQGVDFFTAEDWASLEGIVLDAPGAVSKRPWWCERRGK